MSHWTKIKLNLTDEDVLQKALTRMGFKVEKGSFNVEAYGTSATASLRIDKSVGLQKQSDGTFSMVGDFYHAGTQKAKQYYGQNQKFQDDLTQAYVIEDAIEKLSVLGFEITENEEGLLGSDGMLRMVATSWS